jgi:cation transport ATPase
VLTITGVLNPIAAAAIMALSYFTAILKSLRSGKRKPQSREGS